MKYLILSITCLVLTFNSFSQYNWKDLFYQPVIENLKKDNWQEVSKHIDTLKSRYSDSVMVPFTVKRAAEKAFETQNLEELYTYSTMMLEYSVEKYGTKLPKESRTKWDYHLINTSKNGIYNWAHFYLAFYYFNTEQFDSSLYHVDKANIENYISLPSSGYEYNVICNIHKNYVRSKCLEKQNKKKDAIEVIIPYIFLDNFDTIQHFYSHRNIVNQFISLTKGQKRYNISSDTSKQNIFHITERELYSDNREFAIKKGALLPEGWMCYKPYCQGIYIFVKKHYIPIHIPYYKFREFKNIKEYLESTLYFQLKK